MKELSIEFVKSGSYVFMNVVFSVTLRGWVPVESLAGAEDFSDLVTASQIASRAFFWLNR
jgi:hypothetical protein